MISLMSFDLKVLLFLALSTLGIRLAVVWLSDRQDKPQNPQAASTSADTDTYAGLRNQILQLKREKIGLPAPAKPTEPWAATMDWGVTNGTATVVAISDGTASVYLSSGGGSIGGGQSHDSIRKAAKRMVYIAAELQPQMSATHTYPLPQRGQVTFYVLTDAGVFTASVPQEELSSHRHAFSKLGDAAQDIITQYRLIQKSQ
jgi:hypothetical protein